MNTLLGLLALFLTTLLGCGGKVVVDATGAGGESVAASSGAGPSSGAGAGPSNPVCDTFCQAVIQTSCPEGDECKDRCDQALHRGCEGELSAVLACLPPWINADCLILYPDQNAPCDAVLGGYESCMQEKTGVLTTCNGIETQLIGENSCKGKGDCPEGQRRVECTGQGLCTCTVDGKEVGACKGLINGVEYCSIYTSCCSVFFDAP